MSTDKRLVQQASISSLQRVALPVGIFLVVLIQVGGRALSADQIDADQVLSILPYFGVVSVFFLAVAVRALTRMLKVSKALKAPQAISQVEQAGDRVTIRLANGRAIAFAVKRVFPFPKVTPAEVLAALGRIAPHASAAAGGN